MGKSSDVYLSSLRLEQGSLTSLHSNLAFHPITELADNNHVIPVLATWFSSARARRARLRLCCEPDDCLPCVFDWSGSHHSASLHCRYAWEDDDDAECASLVDDDRIYLWAFRYTGKPQFPEAPATKQSIKLTVIQARTCTSLTIKKPSEKLLNTIRRKFRNNAATK